MLARQKAFIGGREYLRRVSGGMNLARRPNAGIRLVPVLRRLATIESRFDFRRRSATRTRRWPFPALKGQAKFMLTLRVDATKVNVSK